MKNANALDDLVNAIKFAEQGLLTLDDFLKICKDVKVLDERGTVLMGDDKTIVLTDIYSQARKRIPC